MNSGFWLLVALMVALALAFVFYPLAAWRRQRRAMQAQKADPDSPGASAGPGTDTVRQANLAAYRSRLAELDEERASGRLSVTDYQTLRDELAAALLEDVDGAGAGSAPPDSAGGKNDGRKAALAVAFAVLLVLPVAAITLYERWGGLDRIEQANALAALASGDGSQADRIEAMVAGLRARLTSGKDTSPDGWAMLGRSYMQLQRYEDAAWAYRQLAQRVSESDQAQPRAEAAAYGLAAQALFFTSEGRLTGEIAGLIRQARALNPDDINALGLLGLNAFGEERYDDAIRYWQRILEVAPDHPQIQTIRAGIEEARRRQSAPPLTP
ncbi:c-type cytochrome biogenesis protein CcmI [Marinobacter sp. C2H3]|uniref:c-type cytochrome biogenesis protein CcmI n=1 Tax=Marinobacter sp. C2H3 TaxID=3119003 RepID=UPI00300EB2AC